MDDRELLQTIRPLIGNFETSDDCASFDLGDGRVLISSTDMLHETTDFPRGMTEWEMGWMSVAVTLSDLASCGADPKQVLVAVGVDKPERFLPLMKGAVACAETFGAKVSGGDIDSHTELTVVTTAFGIAEKNQCLRRDGANPGDYICITKVPGRAQAALDGDARYWKYLVTPEPEVFPGQKIAKAGASSMMDVSDGISLSLYDLSEASGVGFTLDSTLFPLLPFDKETAMRYFLYGGGDFGLLFTISPERFANVSDEVRIIGQVTEGRGVFCDGEVLLRKGYTHVWDEA